MVDGKLKMFMFLFFYHLFICKLWPLSTFNFDGTNLLLVGAFLVVLLVLQGCFDGHKNKELRNKEVLPEGQKGEKFGKFVKKISDVWCS